MSRKINVRSPFYLFAQPAFTTTTSTQNPGTTTSSSTTGTTTLATYSCSIANLTGGNITSSGSITNPSVTDGSIINVAETNGGTPITSYQSNTGAQRNVILWFEILPNSSYTNTTFWCSHSIVQASGATTSAGTTSAPLPVLSCGTANLTGGQVRQNGTIVNPSVTGGSIILKSLSNGGSGITSVSANNGTTVQSVTLWFKIQPNSNYNQTPVWCSKPYNQGTTTSTTSSTTVAPTTSSNMISISASFAQSGSICSASTTSTRYLLQGASLANGAVVYTNNFGTTPISGTGDWYAISSSGGTTATHYAQISSSGVISNLTVCTATSTTTQSREVFYRSTGKTSTNQFCAGHYSLNTMIYTDQRGSIGQQLGSNVYTTATGSQKFNGNGWKYIVWTSPMVYQGSLAFEWFEITNGVVTDVGSYSGCLGTGGSGGGNGAGENNIY